jgi:hypothetical protein
MDKMTNHSSLGIKKMFTERTGTTLTESAWFEVVEGASRCAGSSTLANIFALQTFFGRVHCSEFRVVSVLISVGMYFCNLGV